VPQSLKRGCRVLALLCALAALAPARGEERAVVVGAVVTQSGFLVDLAADLAKALLLWQEEVNAAGGLLGRRVELKLIDDHSEALAAGKLYEQLILEDRSDALIGPFGTAATLGAAAVAERNRRVLVNATGAASGKSRMGYRYVFQVPAPYTEYGAGPLEIARRMNVRRLAIMARDDSGSREMAERLRERAARGGFEAGEIGVYAPATSNFANFVAAAQKFGAQAWIAFGLPREAAEMVKSFKKLHYAPALFIAQGAADPLFVKLLGQDAEFAMGLAPYERSAGTKDNARFADAFARKWSAAPTALAAEGYAAAKVLEEAVRNAGSLEQEKLRAALAALQTDTPLGPYRVDGSGGQTAAKPLVVQILKGRRQIVWPDSLATAPMQLPYPRWEDRKSQRPGD